MEQCLASTTGLDNLILSQIRKQLWLSISYLLKLTFCLDEKHMQRVAHILAVKEGVSSPICLHVQYHFPCTGVVSI